MNDCETCPLNESCHYPFKPTECHAQRKFWSKERRDKFEDELAKSFEELP
jgi:hypothetical protein